MTVHFPINHIDDVLPHIDGRKDFIVAHKDGYSVIDYVFAAEDTFDHPARIECRGIKFAPDGSILARPFHKFFNAGERPDTQPHLLDFTQPHTIMEKLDGSMIHAAIVDGEVVFMTRMGRTDVARKAERHLTPELIDTVRATDGVTLIFEWIAPDNRIIVRYDRSELVLLAARDDITGEYMPTSWLWAFASKAGVPLVRHHEPRHTSADDFLSYARAVHDAEGFVVRFASGLWVKAKGEDYVLKHRAKDSILQEKNILALVLNGSLDDVLPLLDEPDADAARAYAADVNAGMHRTAQGLAAIVVANDNMPQKEFALEVVPALPAEQQPLAFRVRRGDSALAAVSERIAANCNSQTQVDTCRALHGARWTI